MDPHALLANYRLLSLIANKQERDSMATLIVRNVDEEVKARLMRQAAQNGRSTEAEVREILKNATRENTWISQWLACADGFAGEELWLPHRSTPRVLNLAGGEKK